MNKKNKAEQIEQLCNTVLEAEKANPNHAEIVINRTEVWVKVKNKILGRVVEQNGIFNFQYVIS